MIFNSWIFALFFVLFCTLYFALQRRTEMQNTLIFIASYIFYGAWDVRFLLLIMCCTTTDFVTGLCLSGQRLERHHVLKIAAYLAAVTASVLIFTRGSAASYCLWVLAYVALLTAFLRWADGLIESERRHAYLVGSITYNLTVLCFFKYFNFFADNLVALAGVFGIEVGRVTLSVILPVGISFFTFQSMSFSLDVYRGQLRPTDRITKFAAYISFFPQLVAGPIERAAHLLPQFDQRRTFDWANVKDGTVLFTWGLYKKIVVADNVAPIADAAFNNAASMTAEQMLLGSLAFTIQIYGDFSGYSDMARALAKILGFELMVNFDKPYMSRSPSEFWRRWHISLSSWLRDYLYIGLGGNRHGTTATYRNLLLTMFLGGLWHGATWTFVIWGLYHGIILVLYRMTGLDRLIARIDPSTLRGVITEVVAWAGMSCLTILGWIIFRAQTFGTLFAALKALAGPPTLGDADWSRFFRYAAPLLLLEGASFAVAKLPMAERIPTFVRTNVAIFVLFSLAFMSARGGQQFIYFDF